MPLDARFTRHLHDVMVEVTESLSDSEARYKLELLGKARATHNSAAMPIAYKDAELHRLETRFEKTVERYFQALVEWGIPLDDNTEREMGTHIDLLTSGPNQLHFPPAMRLTNESAYQGDYARARQRLAHRLQLSAKNRLTEIKMKWKREQEAAQRAAQQVQPNVTHVHFNAPVGTAYVHSVHNSADHIEIDVRLLQDIDAVSANHPALQSAAAEIRAAAPDKASMREKAKNWVALAVSVEGLTEKAVQHYPQLVALIHKLSQVKL